MSVEIGRHSSTDQTEAPIVLMPMPSISRPTIVWESLFATRIHRL